MMMIRATGLSLIGGLVLSATAAAADGVLIVQRTTVGTTATTSQVQIEPTRMRAEVNDPSGFKQVVVFDGATQVMWIINAERKSYSELTKADLDRMGGQLQGVMAQMQAQMANLPPAQRAQMEAMMRGRGMTGAAAEKTEYTRTGTDRVGAWTCDKYDGYRGGQKTSEICTVAPAVLKLTVADFAVTQQLASFFKALMPQAADQFFSLGRLEENGFSGLPLKTTTTVAGRTTTIEVTEARRQTFADSVFAVPAGFQKQSMGMGMGQ
jgi:Domain of unknown function (DUF4412)